MGSRSDGVCPRGRNVPFPPLRTQGSCLLLFLRLPPQGGSFGWGPLGTWDGVVRSPVSGVRSTLPTPESPYGPKRGSRY